MLSPYRSLGEVSPSASIPFQRNRTSAVSATGSERREIVNVWWSGRLSGVTVSASEVTSLRGRRRRALPCVQRFRELGAIRTVDLDGGPFRDIAVNHVVDD